MLSPFIYWAQNETNLFVKIDLRNVKNPNVNLDERRLEFSAEGLGAKGSHKYGFSLDFYSTINKEECSVKILDNKVDLIISKSNKTWWPRIISQPQKPAWLKVDFEKWQTEDDFDDETDVRDVREDYPDLYEKLQKEEIGYRKEEIKKVYMITYNFFMYIGYLYVFCVLAICFLRSGMDSSNGAYEAVGSTMCFLQVVQMLEIFHNIFGFTKGNVSTTVMQIFGRLLVLCPIIAAEERMQSETVVFYLFLVWSAIELVRYPYYITQLYKKENVFLTWLRYTIWIPLYPLGILCEGFIILRSIVYFEETANFTISLPNLFNFTFNFPTFLRIYLLFFMVPGGYTLMTYMYRARIKKLSLNKWNKQK